MVSHSGVHCVASSEENLISKNLIRQIGLLDLLAKQKVTATGTATPIANGLEAVFLSQYKVVSSPPILRDDRLPAGLVGNAQLTDPQVALEGVSFAARVVVSADRRFVRLKVTEKATEIDELPKVQLPRKPDGKAPPPDVQDQVADLLAALRRDGPLEPVLSESGHKHEVEIPDGASRAIAVAVGAMREALTKVYHADRIVDELRQ